MKKKLIVGNWKMNGSLQANADLVSGLVQGLPAPLNCGVGVAVPAAYLAQVQALLQGSAIAVAAQDRVRSMKKVLTPVRCQHPCCKTWGALRARGSLGASPIPR